MAELDTTVPWLVTQLSMDEAVPRSAPPGASAGRTRRPRRR